MLLSALLRLSSPRTAVSGAIFQGKPVEVPGSSHRPLWLYFLAKDETKRTCGLCFDVPTVISSCYERAKRNESSLEDVPREIVDFQNALQELVDASPVREKVVIVSIPPPPLDAAALAHVARKV